mmetsp:Transcript_36508/g.67451  ORF Transcript_36508/g.67451 Transcript_36508/m.67451 type:complete len:112 (-) Transcript_36508:164-499(-)
MATTSKGGPEEDDGGGGDHLRPRPARPQALRRLEAPRASVVVRNAASRAAGVAVGTPRHLRQGKALVSQSPGQEGGATSRQEAGSLEAAEGCLLAREGEGLLDREGVHSTE